MDKRTVRNCPREKDSMAIYFIYYIITMKFNIGDRVRLKREVLVDMAKKCLKLTSSDEFIISIREWEFVWHEEGEIKILRLEKDLELVERKDEDNETLFQKVQVSNDKIHWRRLWYIWMNKNNDGYPYICARKLENNTLFIEWMLIDATHRKYMREDKEYLSRKEIAEKFGIDEDFIFTG